MRRPIRASISPILLSALLVTAQTAGANEGLYCEFTMKVEIPDGARGGFGTRTGPTMPELMRGRIWKSGDYVRQELDMGENRRQIIVANPKTLYTLLAAEKIAHSRPHTKDLARTMRANGTPWLLVTRLEPSDYWKEPRREGTDRLLRTECAIWRAAVSAKSRGRIRIWLPDTAGKNLPLKYEVSTSLSGFRGMMGRRSSGVTVTRTVTQTLLRSEKYIPASRFRVPKGYLIREFSVLKAGKPNLSGPRT